MHAVVGVLSDDADPMVTVMKLEKAPQESYADIGGLDQQIQEIKVQVSKINFNDTLQSSTIGQLTIGNLSLRAKYKAIGL